MALATTEYSPQHRVREEYEAEVASMVLFNTLKEYATPQELAASLLIPSATERLELGYAIMIRHRNELNDLVKIVSEELSECGEDVLTCGNERRKEGFGIGSFRLVALHHVYITGEIGRA
eukprot:840074_1